jgi:hypothetical protein
MALSPDLLTFIQSAVRLPSEVLKRIDRDWDRLYPHRLVLTELVQGSDELRRDASELREYVLAEARRAAAEHPGEQLIPEDTAEAVVPAARALLMRGILENSADPLRAHAFAALTEPFRGILPGVRPRTGGQGE